MDEQMEAGQADIAQEQGVSTQESESPMDTSTQDSISEGAAGDQEVAPLKELGGTVMDGTAANPSGVGAGLSGGQISNGQTNNGQTNNGQTNNGQISNGELNIDSLMDVQVTLSVEIGRKRMPINQLVNLSPGAIVDLNRDLDAPLDLLVNGTLIARGEVVVMGKKFGLRLVDICAPNERTRGLV